MWGGSMSSVSGGGSGGGGVASGWVDDNFLSKAFFNQLFAIHIKTRVLVTDPSTTPATVISDTTTDGTLAPNTIIPAATVNTDSETGYVTTTTVTLDSIQLLAGGWTNSYLSALGQNTSGSGGGGGSSTLYGLLDVNIPETMTAANNGQVLMYNHTQGKWINANIPSSGGTVTSIATGTGLSGGPITASGTISINSTYQTYISHGETAYGWGNHDDAGYWKSSSHPTTLGGYGITDAKFGTPGSDYVPITLGSTTKNVLTSHQSLSGYATQQWVLTALADYATKTWVENKGYITSSALSSYLPLTGGSLTGSLTMKGYDIVLGTTGSSSDDSADLEWVYGNGQEKARIWLSNDYTAASGPNYRIYKSDGTLLYNGALATLDSTVAAATKLQNVRTIWGQNFDGTNNVSGGIEQATAIEFSGVNSQAGHGGYIDFHYNGSTRDFTSRIIENASGVLNINYGLFVKGATTYVGEDINKIDQNYRLYVDGASFVNGSAYFRQTIMQDGNYLLMHCLDNGSNALGLMIEGLAQTGNEIRSTFGFHPAGRNISYSDGIYDMTVFSIRYNLSTHDKYAIINNYLNVDEHIAITSNNGYIQIGGGRIEWDATNSMLKVINADGTAGSIYATGGVSALGMSAGVSSISAMTFNYLTVNNKLYFGNTNRYIQMTTGGVCEIETDGSPLFLHHAHKTFIDEDGWLYTPVLAVTNGGIDTFIVNDNLIDCNGTIRVYYNGAWKTLNMQTAISYGIFT